MVENSFYVGNVSTFPPRRCGVGIFAKDMIKSFIGDKRVKDWETIPIVWEKGVTEHAPEFRNHVREEITQAEPNSFEDAAKYIVKTTKYFRNNEIESGWFFNHEYGIFAEDDTKDNIVDMLKILHENEVANIVISHTVLSKPDNHKKRVMQRILQYTDKFICLTRSAIDTLTEVYDAPRGKLINISHGVPEIHIPETRSELKRKCGFVNENGKEKTIFTSVGYLSGGKGLEYVIEGSSKVLKSRADRESLVLLIAGVTHPEVLKSEGEKYRESLIELIKKLKIPCGIVNEHGSVRDVYGNELQDYRDANIVFWNRHLSDSELLRTMKMSDFGVIGNLGEEQISSGPGAYWIGSSRITIATESPFFKDMEAEGIGLLVPFRDSDAFADRMNFILTRPQKERDELEYVASDVGSAISWSITGEIYLNLMEKIITHKTNLRKGH